MDEPKSWRESKTLAFNALTLAFVALETQLHFLQPVLPVNVYVTALVVVPIINAMLRATTTQKLVK